MVKGGEMEHWLIWSNEHKAFWGVAHRGYTNVLDHAGRYNFLEALAICQRANIPSGNSGYPQQDRIPDEIMCPSPEMIKELKS